MGDIDTETVDAAVQPEPQYPVEGVVDSRVIPVQVGLGGVEKVQVPLSVRVPGMLRPGGPAEIGPPVVRGSVRVLRVRFPEVVACPLPAAHRRVQCTAEPPVTVAGVVRDQVDDHPESQVVGPGDEGVGVGEGAEPGVHVAVVGDVVPGVLLG